MPPQRKIITEFINKYRELECLWKVSDKNYKNPQTRSKAKEQLVPILRQIDEDANVYSVTTKINSLRTTFNKERRKLNYSYESGALEIYSPRLWYYDMLLFLVEENKKAEDTKSEIDDTTSDSFEHTEEYYSVTIPGSPCKEASPQSSVASSSISQNPQSASKLKRQRKSIRNDTNSESKVKYIAFGEHVAEKLRCMPSDMSIYCEKIINDAIYNADCGNLNHTSRIVTDY